MYIKIFPSMKNAGQSGRAKLGAWCLQVVGDKGERPNSIIGWSGGNDSMAQLGMEFFDKDAAIAAAKKIGLPYHVAMDVAVGAGNNLEGNDQRKFLGKVVAKNYAENFSYRRQRPWTH